MRRILHAVALASAVMLASSCGDPSGPAGEGSFTATWANKSWNGNARAYLTGDGLQISAQKTSPTHGYALEYVVLDIASPAVGTFPLGPGKAWFTELVGGDVIGGSYKTAEDAAGAVTITRYDGPGGIVEGTVRFDAELSQGHGSYGERNALRDGRFSATVEIFSILAN